MIATVNFLPEHPVRINSISGEVFVLIGCSFGQVGPTFLGSAGGIRAPTSGMESNVPNTTVSLAAYVNALR